MTRLCDGCDCQLPEGEVSTVFGSSLDGVFTPFAEFCSLACLRRHFDQLIVMSEQIEQSTP